MHQASQVPLVSVAASRHHLTRGQHHQMPVLGRDQDAAVPEPVQDEPFQGADRHVSIRQPAGRGSQGNPVRPAQVQAEGLSPLDQPGQVGIATQQVVDQLAARRLLPADPLPPSSLVAPHERSHRPVDDPHHRLSSGAHLLAVPGPHRERKPPPQPPRRRQVQVDSPRRGHPLLSGPAPQDGHGRQLPLTGLTPRHGGISQQGQVVAQQLDRSPRTPRGGHRDRSEPVIVASSRPRVPARAAPLPPAGRDPMPCSRHRTSTSNLPTAGNGQRPPIPEWGAAAAAPGRGQISRGTTTSPNDRLYARALRPTRRSRDVPVTTALSCRHTDAARRGIAACRAPWGRGSAAQIGRVRSSTLATQHSSSISGRGGQPW